MNAMEHAKRIREAREERAALEDSQLIVCEAIRSFKAYFSKRDFFDRIIAIVESNCGTGSFSKTVTLENGKQVIYRFSQAVGMLHSGTMTKYQSTFRTQVPKWVRRRHPYQIHRLCDLAITENRPLPNLAFGVFTSGRAAKARALRAVATDLIGTEIRKDSNRDWLGSVREHLSLARQSMADPER